VKPLSPTPRPVNSGRVTRAALRILRGHKLTNAGVDAIVADIGLARIWAYVDRQTSPAIAAE
jgi:hypothetical protein